jgi:hypothetical protein
MTVWHLRCPDAPSASGEGSPFVSEQLLASFADHVAGGGIDRIFGLELRLAYHYEHVAPPAPQRRPQSLRKFFLRPAVEPILFSWKEDLDPESAGHATVDQYVSSVSGLLARVRDQDARSGKDERGNFAQFPDSDYAARYLKRIAAAVPTLAGPVRKAGYVFAESILSHPYLDGNARLGRGLALLTLSKYLGGFTPLPLGPVLMAHNDRYIEALQSLAASGNWEEFFGQFDWFLAETARLSLIILGERTVG